MDYQFISYIFSIITIILVICGFILIIYITYKYEKKAYDDPKNAQIYQDKRKLILKTYIRLVIAIFIIALIASLLASD